MQVATTIVFFIFGIVLGSFFNVLGMRAPVKALFDQKRSYCYSCKRQLSWKELIPIWSYLVQKGRCRGCDIEISPLYPIIELTTGVLFAFTYCHFGLTHELLLGVLLISLVIPVTVSDIKYQKIPNSFLLFFTPIFIAYRVFYPLTPWWNSLLGAGAAFLLLFLLVIASRGGMGMGDVKYLTLLGFLFGLEGFLLILLLSTVLGVIIGLIKIYLKGGDRKTKLAFAPFLGVAAMTTLYFGDVIFLWYRGFF